VFAALAIAVVGCGTEPRTPAPPSVAQPPLTASPTASSPEFADASSALHAVDLYERSRATGDFSAGWDLLSDEMQAAYGRIEAFRTDSQTYMAGGAGPYNLVLVSADALVATLRVQSLGVRLPSINLERGVIVEVRHPEVTDPTSATEELFVAAPDSAGTWRIFPLA
jgi:hypothetical protein